MTTTERRRYPRHKTEVGVTVRKNGEKTSATLIDISKGGIGLISKRGFFSGAEVDVTVKYFDDYAIHGTVKWAQLLDMDDKKMMYRIGIEADRVLATENILGCGSPE